MARTVPEWRGKTDDTRPSTACQRRILERQDYCCALSGRPFTDKDKPEFDHKVALWLGGENREGNLHAIHKPEHEAKTAAEAKVHAKVNGQHQQALRHRRPAEDAGRTIPEIPQGSTPAAGSSEQAARPRRSRPPDVRQGGST